jgi:hypothetical protein
VHSVFGKIYYDALKHNSIYYDGLKHNSIYYDGLKHNSIYLGLVLPSGG